MTIKTRVTAVNIEPFGWVACAFSDIGLVQSVFFHESESQACNALASRLLSVQERESDDSIPEKSHVWQTVFTQFFQKGDSALQPESVPLDDRLWSSFQKQVYRTLLQTVKWGDTISYGELSRRAGYSGAARAVGTAMARNRCAPIIPCHRVICADGNLGNYSGHGGIWLKKQLLHLESAG